MEQDCPMERGWPPHMSLFILRGEGTMIRGSIFVFYGTNLYRLAQPSEIEALYQFEISCLLF
jgi:hypothetical protein